MNLFSLSAAFLVFVFVMGGCSRELTDVGSRPREQDRIRPAITEMADADKRWHNYRAESLRLKLAGKRDESEYYDRLADDAYNKSNMYYHRIQSGNFSPIEDEKSQSRREEAALFAEINQGIIDRAAALKAEERDKLAYELSCYPIKNCIVTGESISIKNAVKYVYHYPKQRTMDYTRPTEQTVFFSSKSTISIFEKSPEIYLEKLNKIIYDTIKFDVTNLYDDRFFITNTGFYRLENPIISITVKGELYVAKTESFLQIGNRWKLVPENFINPDTNKPCETFIGDIYITVDVPKPVGENNVKLNSSTVKVNVRGIPELSNHWIK